MPAKDGASPGTSGGPAGQPGQTPLASSRKAGGSSKRPATVTVAQDGR
jgi:hypothetical protein